MTISYYSVLSHNYKQEWGCFKLPFCSFFVLPKCKDSDDVTSPTTTKEDQNRTEV